MYSNTCMACRGCCSCWYEDVVNAIPDNWPMGLHLAEGSTHLVQTPSSYLGYRTLKGMDGKKVLNPIPADKIFEVGHYIDHELVANLEDDCNKRLDRINNNKAKGKKVDSRH